MLAFVRVMASHHTPLHLAAAEAVSAYTGVPVTDIKVETPPQKKTKPGEAPPDLGDLAVGCFPLARARGTDPATLAREIAAAFQPGAWLVSASATGPYVNFKADRAAAYRWIIGAAREGTLIPGQHSAGQTICIDFSSPNISKHLAYHHLRGTTLGHALVKINRALGARVVGINFLGDWGTTHGMLLAAWQRWGPLEPLDVTGLNALYVRFRKEIEANPAVEEEGRAWFKRLEDGEPEARALWQRFYDVSWAEFQEVYEILDIEFEEVRGESAYEPDLPRVMQELTDRGLVTESEGALVVVLPDEKTPILLRKQDGATLYATRDMAAAEYHWAQYQFTRKLYVVGREQALHFRQLFKLIALAGHTWADRCRHVPYGHVRIAGTVSSSRLGALLMREVFDVLTTHVRPRIVERNPERTTAEVDAAARVVGIGALVFANLVAQRDKELDFDIDRATSFEGDSGPYVQYSHARCASIARKASERITSLDDVDLSLLVHDAEWVVAKRLFELPEIVARAADASEPHTVCHYLLQLSADFAYWYTLGNGDKSLRVVCDDPALQRARLALTAGVQAALATGLGLLGISAPDWM